MHLSLASGSKFEPLGQNRLDISLGKCYLRHTFLACKNLTQCIILGLEFHHTFRIGTDGKLCLHRNG